MRNAKILNPFKPWRKVIWLFFLVVVIAGGIVFFIRHNHNGKTQLGKNVAFVIDGKNYYKKDVQQLIAYPLSRGVSQSRAAAEAFNDLKDIKAAQNLGYQATSSEIRAQENTIFATTGVSQAQQSQYKDWFTMVATQSAIDAFVNSATTPGYAGYSYVFFFGQHLQSSADYKPAGLNNPKLVAADQAFAKQKAQYYHQQLQAKKISPETALTQSAADMQSLGHSVGNPNFSASFSVGQSLNSVVYMPDIIRYITSTNQSGLSDVKIGKAPNAPLKSGGKNVNMYYYFVDLTAVPAHKPISPAQFNQALKKLAAQYRGLS